jgi:hypothetical protein
MPDARGGAAAVGQTATAAATLAVATAVVVVEEEEEEEDVFGWGSIYFDGEEGDEDNEKQVEGEGNEETGEEVFEEVQESRGVSTAPNWPLGSGEGSAAAADDGESEDREFEEGPGFELQDTVIAGRWRQRRRQGRQEIYFDGTSQSSEQGRPQRDSSEGRP